jgi:hypothetical protein
VASCSYNSQAFFICLLPTTCYVTYKFAVHDYLWYGLGNSSGWPYLSNGVEALSSLEAVIIILLSFAGLVYDSYRVLFKALLP